MNKENVLITSITLKNAQSWKSGTMKVTSGLNIIRADLNSEGKSVFFKLLALLVKPKKTTTKERKAIIRHGCDRAQLILTFSDGSIGGMIVYEKYIVEFFNAQGDAKNLTYYKDTTCEELLDRLSILYDKDTEFFANYLEEESPKLLVTSNEVTNCNLVRILSYNEKMETIINRCEEDIPKYKSRQKVLETMITEIEYQLNNYPYQDESKLQNQLEEGTPLNQIFQATVLSLEFPDKIGDLHLIEKQLEVAKPLYNVFSTVRDLPKVEYIKFNPDCVPLYKIMAQVPEQMELDTESLKFDSSPILCVCDLLDLIDSLNHTSVDCSILTDRDYREFLELVDKLIILDDLNVPEIDFNLTKDKLRDCNKICDIIDSVHKVYNTVNSMNKLFNDIQEDTKSIESMKRDLEKGSEKVQCPIHGVVLYKNGQCVPASK